MRTLACCAIFVVGLLSAGLVQGDDAAKVNQAADRAKAIAPFIDTQTFAVLHVDLTRLAVDPVFEKIGGVFPDKERAAEIKKAIGDIHQRLVHAGVKDVYGVFTFARGWRQGFAFAAIPLTADSDEKAIRDALPLPAVTRHGDVLLAADNPDTLSRVPGMTADPRPELIPALEAAGDTALQCVLLPPKHYRRVLEETTPEIPKEFGGGSVRVLTQGMLWAAIGIDAPPRPAVRLVVQSQDGQAAQAFRTKLADWMRLCRQIPGVEAAIPKYDEMAAILTPKVEGSQLVLILDEEHQGVEKALSILLPPIEFAQKEYAQSESMNNLKQLALAMLNYESAFKHYPAPANYGPDGKPLLSWRVLILPYIEELPLYNEFHLDEPWDSPHNRTLIGKMPAFYCAPISKNRPEKGLTNYLLPVGNGAAFTPGQPTEIKDLTDGTANTILIVEADDDHAVPWTKPDDWEYDPQDPTKGLGHLFEGWFGTAFCDGSARRLVLKIDPKVLRNLFERADGNAIDANALQP
jgi:hypothetical protein